MLADSFWANFVIFAAGQAAAWGYLATGRIARGAALMVGAFVLADVALVARFALGADPWISIGALTAMQAWCVFEAMAFPFARWRRRRGGRAARREALYRAAFVHYLRDELEPARAIWRRLRRSDPWDLEVTVALATVAARMGARRQAWRLLRSASALDRTGAWGDVIAGERRRLAGLGAAAPRSAARAHAKAAPAPDPLPPRPPHPAPRLQAQAADDS